MKFYLINEIKYSLFHFVAIFLPLHSNIQYLYKNNDTYHIEQAGVRLLHFAQLQPHLSGGNGFLHFALLHIVWTVVDVYKKEKKNNLCKTLQCGRLCLPIIVCISHREFVRL